jgi:GDP-L-fucose synthase
VVTQFFRANQIDYVIHCATFRPHSTDSSHLVDEELESNLRMYYSLASQSQHYKKMIYFGSGAEFDKSKPIVRVSEDDFGHSIPKNKYGLGKYIMNENARKSDNIYNFRLFGTINKYERPNKNVISNLCAKAVFDIPLTLRQDCLFSFVDINDVLPIIRKALKTDLLYHDYNLVSDELCYLSDIASIIKELSDSTNSITFSKEGFNLEYTASNKRVKSEIKPDFTSIRDSVKDVYQYIRSIKSEINISEIDDRWK